MNVDRINTKSIYEPISPDDGFRILVTRYYPRGVKKDRFDLWLRDASPSIPLLKKIKSGEIDWQEFSITYGKEVQSSDIGKTALARILEVSKEKPVTLLCYEKEGLNCHRNLLKQILVKDSKR